MALIANVDFQLLARASRGELISAPTGYFSFDVIRMNAVLHGPILEQDDAID